MFRSFVLSAALVFAAAAPAFAQTAPDTTASVPDPASVAMAEQVISNLGMLDVMVRGFDKGIRDGTEFSGLTADQKERFLVVFHQHIDAERTTLVHTLAIGGASKVTRDEMTNMLALSKIGYLKAIIKAGADGAPEPDPAMMSADEKAVFDRFSDADFVGRFLNGIDMNLVGNDMVRIATESYTAFEAETGTKTTG